MVSETINLLKGDCKKHGRGRKAWWARELGVPALTLSHWLAGRQEPNGTNALKVQEILRRTEQDKQRKVWLEYLWDASYLGERIPPKILPMILLEALSLSSLDSRSLALLSRLVEKERPVIEVPRKAWLKNRFGWLLESAGMIAPFSPDRRTALQYLLNIANRSQSMKAHLRHFQTLLGKKWKVLDCPLDETKRTLPGSV